MEEGRKESARAVRVVAALIGENGRFLICRRPAHKARGLLWEFVGGKVEEGESGEEALIRECREELDVVVRPLGVFAEVTHEYPDLTVDLTVYRAEIAEGEPKMLEHCDLRWITPAEIDGYDFCPADESVLEKIRESAVPEPAKELGRIFEKERIGLYGVLRFEDCRVTDGALLERTLPCPRSAIVYAVPYFTGIPEERNLSLYAISKDYHLYLRGLNERLCEALGRVLPGESFVGFGDHSPIDERRACAAAGLGIIGDNGLLITEKYGSYVFLGEVLTTAAPERLGAQPAREIRACLHCGKCRDACPCRFEDCASAISQKKGDLTEEEIKALFKTGLIWGCDLCQTCCPLNQNAGKTPIPFFYEDRIAILDEETLAGMDKKTFRERAFSWRGRSPLRRNLALCKERKKNDEA